MGWQDFTCENCYEIGDEEDGVIYKLEDWKISQWEWNTFNGLCLCQDCRYLAEEADGSPKTKIEMLQLLIELSKKKKEVMD